MNYPLISEYIEAIKSAEDTFEKLSYLMPVLSDDGLPVMTSGNFAVVFKMKDKRDGKLYAVKCFTKEQERRAEAYKQITEELKDVESPYLISVRYLDKELFVDTDQTTETEFPVLLMDWVEGKTLDKYLRENLDNKYALEMLAYRFSQLAQWLIPQPFAHGDLKLDNILVQEDGTIMLVDYDGMYVPAMICQKARELGSPDFRHPLRTEDVFDEHIDDFPLVSILLSLKAISLNPQLLNEYGAANRLLLSVHDYYDIKNCDFLKKCMPSGCMSLDKLSYLFCATLFETVVDSSVFHLLSLNRPTSLIPFKCKNGKYSLFDKNCNTVLECQFNYCDFVDTSLKFTSSCIVSSEWGSWSTGYKNAAIISCTDDLIDIHWYKHLTVIGKTMTRFIAEDVYGRKGIIDDNNRVILNFVFQEIVAIESVSDVYLVLKKNGFYGLLNKELKVVIPCILKNIKVYSNLNIIVYYRIRGFEQVMDLCSLEDCCLPPDYHRIVGNKDGILTFISADDQYRFFSFHKHNYINAYTYQGNANNGVFEFKDSYLLCKREGKNVLLSKDGTEYPLGFPGVLSQFGETIIGVIPTEADSKDLNGLVQTKYSYDIYVFKKNKQISFFTYKSNNQESFELINENTICVSYWPFGPNYIDLNGKHVENPFSEGTKVEKNSVKNPWLVELVRTEYLNPNCVDAFLNYNENLGYFFDITPIGDLVSVSVSWADPYGRGESSVESIGYADAERCYWELQTASEVM